MRCFNRGVEIGVVVLFVCGDVYGGDGDEFEVWLRHVRRGR